MRLIVADTSPLNYLVLIGQIALLPTLFERVFAPDAVVREMRHEAAPIVVRSWAATPPIWLEVTPVPTTTEDRALQALGSGERAALLLARTLNAELILMDDRAAVAVATARGFEVTGTLGVLDLAARRGLIDIASVIGRLRTTSFRHRPEILNALLAQHRKKEG